MNTYVISQIFVVIATIFIGSTYLVKDKKRIMSLCVIYCVFYGFHYLLLGAVTGMIMTMISALRNIWFYKYAKKGKKNSILLLLMFVLIAIVSGGITYQDGFSLISIAASILSTYSLWQDNVKVYRFLAIPVSFCFILYAVHIDSLFSIVTEVGLLIVEIIGIISIKIKSKNINLIEENEV